MDSVELQATEAPLGARSMKLVSIWHEKICNIDSNRIIFGANGKERNADCEKRIHGRCISIVGAFRKSVYIGSVDGLRSPPTFGGITPCWALQCTIKLVQVSDRADLFHVNSGIL